MQNALKQFGEKATALFKERFFRTRFSLTVMYVAVLAVILFLSASIARTIFFGRVEHRFAKVRDHGAYLIVDIAEPPSAEEVKKDFMQTLIMVNGFLLLFAGAVSYVLAGLTLEPIARAYERQRQFLSDASHELRTPLAVLKTELENAELVEQDVNRKEKIQSYLEEVGRMGNIVNDLLLLSRVDESGGVKKRAEAIDLDTLLQSSVSHLRTIADSKRVHIALHLNQTPSVILAPREMFIRAFENVLKNAILYNKPQGEVSVVLTRKEKFAIITVKDSGVGISPEDQEHIFDRFYRGDQSRSRESGGSGLGLSIVEGVLREIGGEVSLESTLGLGTTVTMMVPLHKPS